MRFPLLEEPLLGSYFPQLFENNKQRGWLGRQFNQAEPILLGYRFKFLVEISNFKQTNKIIILLQKIGLIQSKEMHDLHHASPYDINYCVMTNYLNPILTYINFWYKVENLLYLFGIKTTRGLNIRKGV